MSKNIKDLEDKAFQVDVLEASDPVLVDFWAEWCGPCKTLAPILDEIANEYKGKLTVAKLNIDDQQETAKKYGVRGIPTLLLFKDGKIAANQVGLVSKTDIKKLLDTHL
ncbi:thioredoxin TrxA [Candidatus Regiella endosymbiont of Tuberolachnus salignus]|uniref:thioredoxin TrxA n=1 Tax=Candidatus Regiella endosymbiont of Tuberolachnus salignus TaxID=3077956 RepID=UPI0030D5A061